MVVGLVSVLSAVGASLYAVLDISRVHRIAVAANFVITRGAMLFCEAVRR